MQLRNASQNCSCKTLINNYGIVENGFYKLYFYLIWLIIQLGGDNSNEKTTAILKSPQCRCHRDNLPSARDRKSSLQSTWSGRDPWSISTKIMGGQFDTVRAQIKTKLLWVGLFAVCTFAWLWVYVKEAKKEGTFSSTTQCSKCVAALRGTVVIAPITTWIALCCQFWEGLFVPSEEKMIEPIINSLVISTT